MSAWPGGVCPECGSGITPKKRYHLELAGIDYDSEGFMQTICPECGFYTEDLAEHENRKWARWEARLEKRLERGRREVAKLYESGHPFLGFVVSIRNWVRG